MIPLIADRRALKQITINLLSNAVKFTPDGGTVTVRSRRLENSVILLIADTGIGIAPQSLARLGRPFEQVESQLSKTYHGSGLGLAIAKSLTKLQGGSMRLRSKLGAGTVVMVTLPRDGRGWSRACRARPNCSRGRPPRRPAAQHFCENPPHLGLSVLDASFQRREVGLVGGPRQQAHQVSARRLGAKSFAQAQSQDLSEILIKACRRPQHVGIALCQKPKPGRALQNLAASIFRGCRDDQRRERAAGTAR